VLETKTLSDALDDLILAWGRSPEYLDYSQVRLTIPRAQILARQFGMFVRNRRSCWAHLAGNAPLDVKRAIILHEHEELIYDPLAGSDHYTLWVRQAAEIGVSADEMEDSEPLPASLAAFLAWEHIAIHRPWLEAFGASTILERTNDNRLLKGRGHAALAGQKWKTELGLSDDQLPNWSVHKVADDAHSSMGQQVLDTYARDSAGSDAVLRGAANSLLIHRAFFGGMAAAMRALPEPPAR